MTPAEKAAFEERGYHVLRGALSTEEVATYREALARLLQTPADHPYSRCLLAAPELSTAPENPRGIWAAFDLPLFDDAFWHLVYQPRLALAVDALIGPDINLFETSAIAKPPGFPGTFRDWHQDSEYSDPQSNDRHVTAIVYLDPQEGDSGATWVVPGTHCLGALPHAAPTEIVTSRAREVADKARFESEGVSFHFEPGDALIFLVRLVHKSGANRSATSRFSVALNYTRADTRDTARPNHYVGGYLPIVRDGRLFNPGGSTTC